MVIILLTDYPQLYDDLSSTFGAICKYESFRSIKRRHAKYYWTSKCLKETVSKFGQSYDYGMGLINHLRGPFYLGLDSVKTVSEFQMNIFVPILTSTQITVAINNGGDNGMLLEFENSKGYARLTKGFDVSWISRYGLQNDNRCEQYNLYFIP